ncbi:hypothetical protein JCM9492_07830 [Aquifex pyrophilus]
MDKLGLLFLSGVLSCSGAYKDVVIEKPSPCYFVKSVERKGNEAYVYLERERGKICTQVIVKDRVRVERDVEKIRVIVDNRVWKEYKEEKR